MGGFNRRAELYREQIEEDADKGVEYFLNDTLQDRVARITSILREHGFLNISLQIYRPRAGGLTGYYRLRGYREEYTAHITEFIVGGAIVKYSYTLMRNDRVLLRYDNAPHYPNLSTYPHHKHLIDMVEPLHDPSIESLINEALRTMKR